MIKDMKNGGILDKLIFGFFLLAIILLSVLFILKFCDYQNGKYEYTDINGKQGKAKRCYNEIISEPPTSENKIKCELKDGTIIEVKKYNIIGRKLNDWRY